MKNSIKSTINADDFEISLHTTPANTDYLSITDIAKYKSDDPTAIIQNWMRNLDTIDFLGLWEKLNNPDFKPLEFEGFKKDAGRNAFALSPKKWIEGTDAIGIYSKSGRYGGTFAHLDIAFEFASWISAEFKLYIIKDYQRLKSDEEHKKRLDWNMKRELTKINYRIHTDAIKEYLIPEYLSKKQISYKYANEADVLNMALFGITSKCWKEKNTNAKGNIRDHASIHQLIVLINLESMNAELIKQGISQSKRLKYLNNMAIEQMTSLLQTQPENDLLKSTLE